MTGFCPFLKAFSCNTDLGVTLGEFTVKTQNFGRRMNVQLT